jgi:hypothetical protein
MDLHGARGGNHRAEWVVRLQGCVTIVVLAAARSRSAAIVAASARAGHFARGFPRYWHGNCRIAAC